VETPFGTFSWGKQWSPYYDVAGLTDMFFTLGGEASGAYGPGDGGIPGTGRSEKALQYRHRFGPVHVGAQVQNRARTDENVSYADTYGFMAGLDVTYSPRIAEEYLDRLAAAGNRAGRFLADAFVHYLAFYRSRGFTGACMHDVHAVMALVRPELYTAERVCIDVETAGELTRGQTVADFRGLWNRPAQTRLLTGVDETIFLDEFATRIARLP